MPKNHTYVTWRTSPTNTAAKTIRVDHNLDNHLDAAQLALNATGNAHIVITDNDKNIIARIVELDR